MKVKTCKYCDEKSVLSDDYIYRNDLIHEERCINRNCRALNYAKITKI